MFGAEKGTADRLDGKKLHIGIVQARFNESITNSLAAACRAELLALGVQEKNIKHVLVPGALEVPVAAGLALFGVYSLVEARYRSIHRPPVDHIKREVEKVASI